MLNAAKVQMAAEAVLKDMGTELELFEQCAAFWVVRFRMGGELVGGNLRQIETPENVTEQIRGIVVAAIKQSAEGIGPTSRDVRPQLINKARAKAIEDALVAADTKAASAAVAAPAGKAK